MAIILEAIVFDRWYTHTGRKMMRPNKVENEFKIVNHLVDTVMQIIMKTISYAFMLVAMTFNGSIIVTMLLCMFFANFGFGVLGDYFYIKARRSN